MTKQTGSSVVKEDEIDLRELLGVLIDRKWWIIGTTALFFIVGAAYALLASPVYQAQSMVQVESKVPAIPGISDLASMGAPTAQQELRQRADVCMRARNRLNRKICLVSACTPVAKGQDSNGSHRTGFDKICQFGKWWGWPQFPPLSFGIALRV